MLQTDEAFRLHEIISDRLYTVRHDLFNEDCLKGITTVINLSSNDDIFSQRLKDNRMFLAWDMAQDVDEKSFEGLVRFCSSIMRGEKTSILLIGFQDTIDVISACIVREHLGCKPEIALGIVRENRTKCMTQSELLETVFKYRIS